MGCKTDDCGGAPKRSADAGASSPKGREGWIVEEGRERHRVVMKRSGREGRIAEEADGVLLL